MIKTNTIRWPKKSKIWETLILALETILRLKINILHFNNLLLMKIKRNLINIKIKTQMDIWKKILKNRNHLFMKINKIRIKNRILAIKKEIKKKQIRINQIIHHWITNIRYKILPNTNNRIIIKKIL